MPCWAESMRGESCCPLLLRRMWSARRLKRDVPARSLMVVRLAARAPDYRPTDGRLRPIRSCFQPAGCCHAQSSTPVPEQGMAAIAPSSGLIFQDGERLQHYAPPELIQMLHTAHLNEMDGDLTLGARWKGISPYQRDSHRQRVCIMEYVIKAARRNLLTRRKDWVGHSAPYRCSEAKRLTKVAFAFRFSSTSGAIPILPSS